MAASINRVVLVGNLTRDPELRSTPGGTPVCSLRVAVNSRRRDESGQWIDKPNYFSISVFGNKAESCSQYLSKGRPVAIDGRLDWREWQAQDGSKRESVEIVAESVQFLGSRGDGGGEPQRADGHAGRRVPQLGVAGQVADENDAVDRGHRVTPPLPARTRSDRHPRVRRRWPPPAPADGRRADCPRSDVSPGGA